MPLTPGDYKYHAISLLDADEAVVSCCAVRVLPARSSTVRLTDV